MRKSTRQLRALTPKYSTNRFGGASCLFDEATDYRTDQFERAGTQRGVDAQEPTRVRVCELVRRLVLSIRLARRFPTRAIWLHLDYSAALDRASEDCRMLSRTSGGRVSSAVMIVRT